MTTRTKRIGNGEVPQYLQIVRFADNVYSHIFLEMGDALVFRIAVYGEISLFSQPEPSPLQLDTSKFGAAQLGTIGLVNMPKEVECLEN